jgi:hypothetical protein
MGWRFRRSLRILPGVRLNISKRGLSSVSVGRRGLTLNVGRKGTKGTIGLPGTGISYTTPVQHLPSVQHPAPAHDNTTTTLSTGEGTTVGWGALLVAVVFIVGLVFVLSALGRG